MNFIHNLTITLGQFAISITDFLGYPGIFFLMILESTAVPIPSESILPFAGFLAGQGRFNFWLVLIFATLGSLAGSVLSYYIGLYGGNKVIRKWGRYIFLDEEDLIATEKWFAKRGELTIFIGRFIPVVRHLISIPAGIGKMEMKKFCIYSVLGAGIWNGILIYVGMVLGRHWENLKGYSSYLSVGITLIVIIMLLIFAYRHIKKKKKSRQ